MMIGRATFRDADQHLVHIHRERPHQGLGNRPLAGLDDPLATLSFSQAEVVCQERLGGSLKHYYRKVA